MVGAYYRWACITYLGTPLPVTLLAVVIAAPAGIGDRSAIGCARCRPPASRRCFATIGIALCWISLRSSSHARPARRADPVARLAHPDRGGTIGALDILIAGMGSPARSRSTSFWVSQTRLGGARNRLDRDAAQPCGVDVNR